MSDCEPCSCAEPEWLVSGAEALLEVSFELRSPVGLQ
jgi:hypothetical protein